MFAALTLVCSFAGAPAVETICLQVAPVNVGEKWTRSPKQTRGVIVIHGFYLCNNETDVPKANLRSWQQADAPLMKELGKHADVFVFAYGQNVTLETVLKEGKLGTHVASLRKAGYSEIILIGHSAGGLIARQFVEDHPDAGVHKVFQVCAPNTGSPFAIVPTPKNQRIFLDCMREENCRKRLEARADKFIPKHVQFVSVVGKSSGSADSDGIVYCHSQWSPDLQKQGIPAVAIASDHGEIMRNADSAAALAKLMLATHDRLSPSRLEETKKVILGK